MFKKEEKYSVVEDLLTGRFLLQETSEVFSSQIEAWIKNTYTLNFFSTKDDALNALKKLRLNNNERYKVVSE